MNNFRYKKFLLLIITALYAPASLTYNGDSHNNIRNAVFSNPYTSLPTYQVNKDLFGPAGDRDDNQLLQAAKRTLIIKDDLYDFPQGQKLLQPNGICFSGEWIVDQPSSFTGLFSIGTHSYAIVRASVSLSDTMAGNKRAFSMAIKLFPGSDPNASVMTRNLFVMESIAGSRKQYFLDAVMDNAPPYGGMPSFGDLGIALRLRKDLTTADAALSPAGPDLTYRPITGIAKPINNNSKPVIAPKWLRLRIHDETPRIKTGDFREELRIEHYPQQQLIWLIDVAPGNERGKSAAEWQHLGKLVLTSSVTSLACDTRLHFAHPLKQDPGVKTR